MTRLATIEDIKPGAIVDWIGNRDSTREVGPITIDCVGYDSFEGQCKWLALDIVDTWTGGFNYVREGKYLLIEEPKLLQQEDIISLIDFGDEHNE